MADDAADKPAGAQFERWLSLLGSVIAPASLIGALLFYFGYVSSRAQYDYFGIDIDSVGLSTQDYVMRSPQPLLVPLLVLALLGAALTAAHARIRRSVTKPNFRTAIQRSVLAGLILVGVGVVMLFVYPLMADWDLYPLVTPLLLGIGGALTAYGLGTLRYLDTRVSRPSAVGPCDSTARRHRAHLGSRRRMSVLGNGNGCEWSGLGLARNQAQNLDDLPSVIVDTQERLYLPVEAGVTETPLPASEDDTYHYRYWGLRLLIVGDGQLFLVPNQWSSHDTTLVLPFDDSVRVQFQFRNVEP